MKNKEDFQFDAELFEVNFIEPCKEIFHDACREIGRYYTAKGFKYFDSRPKVVYKDDIFKLEICFWSSSSNTPGRYVNLEILPWISVKKLKAKGEKGIILGHTELFIVYDEDSVGNRNKTRLYQRNHNVFSLTQEGFDEIIRTIDEGVLPWLEKLKTREGVKEMMDRYIYNFKGSTFEKYIQMYFPNLLADSLQ